jgi:hypothetical protein
MTKHGGKREGSGRTPLPPEEKKQAITFKFSPRVIEWLRSKQNYGPWVERLITKEMEK